MGNERLTFEILTQASGQDTVDRLTTAINRYAVAAESAATRSSAGFGGVAAAARNAGTAVDQLEPKWRKLGLAIKDVFEGRTSFAAVEGGYFAQSLGAIGIGAGVAAAAVLGVAKAYETAKKSSETFHGSLSGLELSLRTSNDELKVTNDRLENEIAKLEGKPQNNLKLALDEARLSADKLGGSLGKALGSLYETLDKGSRNWANALAHGEVGSTGIQEELGGLTGFGGFRGELDKAQGDPVKSRKLISDQLAKLQGELTAETMAKAASRGGLSHDRNIEFLNAEIGGLSSQRDYIDETTRNTADEKMADRLKSAKELSESSLSARAKEQVMLKGGMDESLGGLKRDHDVTNAEETKYWESRLSLVDSFGGRYLQLHKDIVVKLGDLGHERNESNKRVSSELGNVSIRGFDENSKLWDESQRRAEEFVISDATKRSHALDLESERGVGMRSFQFDRQRSAAQRSAGLTPPGASQDMILASRIAVSKQLQQIDQNEGQLQVNEAFKLYSQTSYDEVIKKQDAADKLVKISQETNRRIYQDTTATLDLIHDYQSRQMEEFRSEVGSLFNAVTSRDHMAVRDLMRSQLLSFGRTVTENAAQQYIYPVLQKAQGALHTTGTLGKLFSGTPFGPDPLKAGPKGTLLDPIYVKPAEGTLASGGAAGGSSGIPGVGSLPLMQGNSLSTIAAAMGLSSPSIPAGGGMGSDGLPLMLGNPLSLTALAMGVPASATLSSRITAGMGFAGALAAGGTAIYSGIKQGGVGGDLKAAGGAAGMAGSLVGSISSLMKLTGPLLSAIPIVGSVLSAALPLIGGLFNGPQQRSNQLNAELGGAQYIAPTALNVTQSSGGTFADFGYKGNLRDSGFSPYPQVREGSVWEQTHGIFGGPPTFYDVPGGQTGQFGAPVASPSIKQGDTHIWNVNAMDMQSFSDFASRNHMAIGNAVAKNADAGHLSLVRAMKRAARFS